MATDDKPKMSVAELIAMHRKHRENMGWVDSRGVARASKEACDWHNKLNAMREAGATPEEMKAELEPSRIALRQAGHNV